MEEKKRQGMGNTYNDVEEILLAKQALEREIAEHKATEEATLNILEDLHEIKEGLSQAAGEWQRIFDAISDLIIIQDTTHTIIKANKAFCKVFNLELKDIIGKKCYEIIHKSDKPWSLCPLVETLKDSKPHTVEVIDDNIGMPLMVNVSPIFNEAGDMIGAVHIASNISEAKKAENELKVYAEKMERLNDKTRKTMNQIQEKDQRLLNTNEELKIAKDELESLLNEVEAQRGQVIDEKNWLDTIIHQMGEGVIVINNNKEVELINDRAKELLGYSETKEIPRSYKKFFILQLWREMNEAKKDIIKKEVKLERPREATLMITLARLSKMGKSSGFVAVLRDITVERRIEKMKSDSVANVSHEVRSPMTPIKDAVSLILDGTAGPVSEQQKRFLNLVNNNIARLLRLINDLLDLSKIEAGRMELNKRYIDLGSVVKDTVESIRTYAIRKEIEIKINIAEKLVQIDCDKDRIIQVIVNLVMNAFKFTPKHGVVTVEVAMVKGIKGEDSIQVRVSDTGPGISSQEAAELFDRFKQLDTGKKARGTGLGLSISKAIVEMHGGKIWVESEIGKGAMFTFMLPVKL